MTILPNKKEHPNSKENLPEVSQSDTVTVEEAIHFLPTDTANSTSSSEDAFPITPSVELLTTIQQTQATLLQHFTTLQDDFTSKIKYDRSQQTIIDSLHKDLQDNRDGLHYKILKPLFIDLIHLYDDMAQTLQTKPDTEAMSEHEQKVWKGFVDFQKSIEDLLYRHGVEIFHEDQDVFVPKTQQIRKKIPTNEHNLDRCVADSLKPGFIYENTWILRPEVVAIHQYQEEGDN